MSSGEASRKAWLVATSIGMVETSKDQGVARWNGPFRELHQRAETKLSSSYLKTSSFSHFLFTSVISSSSWKTSTAIKSKEESMMNKVLEMNCFGPNSIRF
uniref:uncharacterized protein LOC122599100 n=1 Tax=Erigeron canadensis TaxID=72917 RepID=UPI001CB97226|nr:uncharacterized protein LOC122599100 [Erigeron canadensis]